MAGDDQTIRDSGTEAPPRVSLDLTERLGLAQGDRAGPEVRGWPRPILAAPTSVDGYSPVLAAYHDRGGRPAEEYRALRTNLLARNPAKRFCCAVTSALGREGKTVTCLNLGFVMAELIERRTIVVDFDLRSGRLAQLMKVKPQPGVADLLRQGDEIDLSEVIQPTVFPNLHLIPAGEAALSEIGQLFANPHLEVLVKTLCRDFDHVLLDTPPLCFCSEAAMVAHAVGTAVVVVRMHKTRRDMVEKAIRLLRAANVKVAGLTLTGRRVATDPSERSGYYHYYRRHRRNGH